MRAKVAFLGFYALTLLFVGCGGGKGESESTLSYSGVMTQAVLNDTTVQGFVLDGFLTSGMSASVGRLSAGGEGTGELIAGSADFFLLTHVFKQSVLNIDILPDQPRTTVVALGVEADEIHGDCGGKASYRINIAEESGEFSGTYTYADFCSNGVILSGSFEILGLFDPGTGFLQNYRMTFNSIRYESGDEVARLGGSITVVLSDWSDLTIMDMVIINEGTRKNYWLNNYRMSGNGFYRIDEFSGRYYDFDFGYVDFVSLSPITSRYSDLWPNGGSLRYQGANSSGAEVIFYPGYLELKLDEDGDSSWEWQKLIYTGSGGSWQNRNPFVELTFDSVVNQWDMVQIDASESWDPDGDTLRFYWSFQSCPGSCPNIQGAQSALAKFRPVIPGEYIVRLTVDDNRGGREVEDLAFTVLIVTQSMPQLFTRPWEYALSGPIAYGSDAIAIGDTDGDGNNEIVLTHRDHNGAYWYVLKESSLGYLPVHFSPLLSYRELVSQLMVADVNGDGKNEIIAAFHGGTIRFYNGQTYEEIYTQSTKFTYPRFLLDDVDGNGRLELIVDEGGELHAFEPMTSNQLWTVQGGGVLLANVDDDPALEIIGTGTVIDGATRIREWDYPERFGFLNWIAAGDLNGNGRDEIIGTLGYGKISIFDATTQTIVGEVAAPGWIRSVAAFDVNGNGRAEILYGDDYNGAVHCVDGVTLNEIWSIPNPGSSVLSIALGDVDNDGADDLLWSALVPGIGGNSANFFVADPDSGTIKWRNRVSNGPLGAVTVGDVDGDGRDDILMVTASGANGNAPGTVFIFDALTHGLKREVSLEGIGALTVRSVRLDDIDGNGKREYVVAAGTANGALIQVYDGQTGALKMHSVLSGVGGYSSTLEIADLNGDGLKEIIVGLGKDSGAITEGGLVVLDATTLAPKWRSSSLWANRGEVYDIAIAEGDDGKKEIIVSLQADGLQKIHVFEGMTFQQKGTIDTGGFALIIDDVDGTGKSEIVVGKKDGFLEIYDGISRTLKRTLYVPTNQPIKGLQRHDFNGDGIADWVVSGDSLLMVICGANENLLWQAGLDLNLAEYNQITIKDINGDGKGEIVIGANSRLYHFR
jgi:hypothetical protein